MIWTNEYLNRIALEAETEIAQKTQCIIDRISLATLQYQAEFTLPDYVFNVRKVYWKGWRLDPISGLDISSVGYDIIEWIDGAFEPRAFTSAYLLGSAKITSISGSGVKGGKPVEYFYSKFGENVIRLNPGADEELNVYINGLWSDNIDKSLIVEFYRFPDGVSWKIPDYIRRRTIKAYVLWKAFLREGSGQNLQAAQYWMERYGILLGRAIRIINSVYSAQIYTRKATLNCNSSNCDSDYGYQGPCKPPRPVLPSNYGITVDEWCD